MKTDLILRVGVKLLLPFILLLALDLAIPVWFIAPQLSQAIP